MSSTHASKTDENAWTPLFDHFNQTIRTEADTLFKHIADSQTNLINERNALRKEIEILRQQKYEMTQLLTKYDQIVTLNIGGQLFSTTSETLTKEECLFTEMFSGRYDLREHQGATFIDRDPTHFRILLNYLRANMFLQPKSEQERAELLAEAEFYQITSLIKQLKNEPTKTVTAVEKLFFDPILHHPQVTISGNGLRAAYSGACVQLLYAEVSNTSWHVGRHYWEVILGTADGCYASMGIATSSWNPKKRLGNDCFSWTLRLRNQRTDFMFTGLRHNSQSLPYYNTFSPGTRIGALLDLDEGTLEYVIDGIKRGVAFDNLKGHNVTPVFEFCHDTFFQMNHNATTPNI